MYSTISRGMNQVPTHPLKLDLETLNAEWKEKQANLLGGKAMPPLSPTGTDTTDEPPHNSTQPNISFKTAAS